MASTYSTLKIQLMATGENSGTWGNVTNTNLGTALEEAIVGSADVTFASADVTLTLTDTNATQTARNLRLNLTGTVAAPQNLIVPAIEKLYLVNNGLTQTITVKNSTGTGIAVPAGKTLFVYNNGTNVVDAVTHLTSLTLGTALASGQGGTGLTTFTAANNAIYSTSASALTAGTLPGSAGGTGLTGFTAANNAIYSTSTSALTAGTLPVAAGGTSSTTLTLNNVILGNTTGAVKFVAPGTSGNVLTSDGTIWTSAAASGFPTGTVMLFAQTAAPTGWTKDATNYDNSALRVVTGTASNGGSVAFTTAFASQTPSGSISIDTTGLSSGATTLTTPQIPSHLHTGGYVINTGSLAPSDGPSSFAGVNTNTGSTGGGGSHTHPVAGSATATFTGNAINLAVKYVDVIRATKN